MQSQTRAQPCLRLHASAGSPKGAPFSLLAVVPRDKVEVTENADKLAVVDPDATIQRHACKDCGVHMYGRIENNKHAFYGLDFVHPELSPKAAGRRRPSRRSFPRSSKRGVEPEDMGAVRSRLKELGLRALRLPEPAADGRAGDARRQAVRGSPVLSSPLRRGANAGPARRRIRMESGARSRRTGKWRSGCPPATSGAVA